MTRKLIILILTIASITVMSSCEFGSTKSKIARTMREYVEPGLANGETFHFIGLTNHRDTIFMGTSYPCVGVIYTITDTKTGNKTRKFADVVFSNDYKTALSVKMLDFDPIDYVEEKLREAFKDKIMEKLGK
ncbi:MAG: hypothetical protein NC248_11545 [Bacteroides sp.]|nr:hypothetical protein [Bacteroides sp.]MCM1391065.1 hypothetical protein [Bacteroides sp.]